MYVILTKYIFRYVYLEADSTLNKTRTCLKHCNYTGGVAELKKMIKFYVRAFN